MPSFSLRRLSVSNKGNKPNQGLARSISTSVDQADFVIPLSLSISTSTLNTFTSETRSVTSATSNYAQMLDDDNLAWGPSKPKNLKSSRSKWL
ncbi:unnamed protein product [Somion occarium]|uniref:Uncharacterized protein n=1 Tax=Somion occarium TaxID=3059160 RepID=A0ABP1CRB9_9APHY